MFCLGNIVKYPHLLNIIWYFECVYVYFENNVCVLWAEWWQKYISIIMCSTALLLHVWELINFEMSADSLVNIYTWCCQILFFLTCHSVSHIPHPQFIQNNAPPLAVEFPPLVNIWKGFFVSFFPIEKVRVARNFVQKSQNDDKN